VLRSLLQRSAETIFRVRWAVLGVTLMATLGRAEPRPQPRSTGEANKELVTKTLTAFIAGDVESAFANMADDVTWLVPGNMAGVSGLKRGKVEILKFMTGTIGPAFPHGLQADVHHAYDEGNTVILELTNRGTAANGKQYENEYCFVLEIGDGKIRRIREYVDTQKAKEILFN